MPAKDGRPTRLRICRSKSSPLEYQYPQNSPRFDKSGISRLTMRRLGSPFGFLALPHQVRPAYTAANGALHLQSRPALPALSFRREPRRASDFRQFGRKKRGRNNDRVVQLLPRYAVLNKMLDKWRNSIHFMVKWRAPAKRYSRRPPLKSCRAGRKAGRLFPRFRA